LALDDVHRDAFARELDGVGMAKLMRREPAPDPSLTRELAQFGPGSARPPRPPARCPVDHAEQRTDWQRNAMLEPKAQLLEATLVHRRVAAFAPLAVSDPKRPPPLVDVRLIQRQRF
jgi:hypothetical protein